MNYFVHDPILEEDVALEVEGETPCIEVIPDRLVTGKETILFGGGKSRFEGDVERDVLKIVYVNRYRNGRPRVGLIHGMGLKKGALATSIAHDSHNIIAVGTNDTDLTAAINEVIDARGGLALCGGGERYSLPLPIGDSQVVMKHEVPLLTVSAIISLVAFSILIALGIVMLRRNGKKGDNR